MDTRPPVLAGIGSTPHGLVVAEVAAAEAARRQVPLRLTCSRAEVARSDRPEAAPAQGAPAGAGVDDIVAAVRTAHPDLDVLADACRGDFADVLVTQSRDAALLVVDTRDTAGRDPVLGRWLPDRVITHAHCPVLVIGTRAGRAATTATRLPVVVGIDGSAHSAAAVPHAFEAAALRRVPLRAIAVHCVSGHSLGGLATASGYSAREAQAHAAAAVTEALSGWAEKYPHVNVIAEPMYAPEAAGALVDASAAADLVVVGARGRTTITSLVLGSTSRRLVEYAHCPVLITHAWV